jgi:hypothetical protein
MAPTVASNARARRAHSAEPTMPTVPSPTHITPDNSRAGSIQPPSPTLTSPKPIKRIDKAPSKLQALSSRVGLTPREIPSSSKPVSAKLSQKALNDTTAAPAFEGNQKLQRTGYGDARAAREDQMGAAMAATAQAKGLIDDETAKNWGTSWRTKGQIELNWSEQVVAKYNAQNGIVSETMMSLKEAEAIKKKKDQDLKEWFKAFAAGLVDENGNPTGSGVLAPIVKSKSRERDARREAAKEVAAKTDPLHKVEGGCVTKKIAPKKTPELPTIAEASSPAPFPGLKSAVETAATKTATKPTRAAPKKKAARKSDEAPIAHDPELPSYAEYGYSQLAALCRKRNIKSGGGAQAVRNILIRDDILVTTHQEHLRDAKNYLSREDFQTEAPEVPNAPNAPPAVYVRPAQKKKTSSSAPKKTASLASKKQIEKRALDDDDEDGQPMSKGKKVQGARRIRDDDDDDDNQLMPKSKKLKTT